MSGSGGDGVAEDSDDSSSSPLKNSILDEFREKWHRELRIDNSHSQTYSQSNLNNNELQNNENSLSQEEIDELKAKSLFLEGSELERRGKVYEAISLYRRAVQIVPDIEFKIYESTMQHQYNNATNQQQNDIVQNKDNSDERTKNDTENVDNLDDIDLIARFTTYYLLKGKLCERSSSDNNLIITSSHISDLPMEIILYILRWVVSTNLDMRSLEQVSHVCKGFYVCARDEEIWRQACVKVWGVNIGNLKTSLYSSWRQMFLERSRVHYSGCYISKTSYLRYGENSFQDQFYRPIQLVQYYRYIRFFPDGHILMLTSADDPTQCIGKLKSRNPHKNEILKGHYRLHGDLVIIVLKRNRSNQQSHITNRRRNSNLDILDNQTFYIEFNVVSTIKKKFNQLQWKHYSIIQTKNKREIKTDFELTPSKYPTFYYSRVKSYDLESEYPLQ